MLINNNAEELTQRLSYNGEPMEHMHTHIDTLIIQFQD